MFKWVVGLCALMYLTLLTVGEPTASELAAREARDALQVSRTISKPLETAAVQIAAANAKLDLEASPAVITAVSEVKAPALVSASTSTTSPAATVDVTTQPIAATPRETNPIRRVTGKRVNLRAGPSTTSKIVGRAVRDDSAEVVEMLPSGWAKVYILETGTEAYISAQFLSDAG
ncbi:SH3 domain-containing protein [Litoreibacter albidus]|uniref:SH3 domain-containing protein n=1 Tax=Litoreibacter albidus TaxID=670155 RepID=A0A1H2UMH5_9RHOB|nr:SH3 domain-containing protein [Litoreibacter albidus]SDW57311.1 SH3 domain-containing protein [Litoreibacter albidus]